MLVKLLSIFLLLASGTQQRPVTVPDWAGQAQCSVGADLQSIKGGAALSVLCDANVEDVSCTFERAEPIDISKSEVCRVARLAVKRADPLRVRSTEESVQIDWLELDVAGNLVSVASRTVDIKEEAVVQVTRAPSRYLRFSRSGASPITVNAEELLGSNAWSLPRASKGGELVIWSSPGVVAPVKYVLTGSAPREIVRDQQIETVPALVPGSYLLTPVYSSGISGAARPVTITGGASSVVAVAAEAVGAARVTVGPNGCHSGADLALSSLKATEANTGTMLKLIGRFRLTECAALLDGIAPGLYRVSLRSDGNTMVTKDVQIGVQRVDDVFFDVGAIMITGRVTLNSKPFAGLTLQFSPVLTRAGDMSPRDRKPTLVSDSRSGEGVKVTTSSDGSYTTFVGSRGTYAVTANWGSAHLLGHDRELKVPGEGGSVVLDISLTGGFLEFDVTNWDRQTAVQIELRHTGQPSKAVGGASITGVTYSLSPKDNLPLRIPGIAFGDYLVNAHQLGDPLKVAPRREVKLDADSGGTRVSLHLAEQRSTLQVADNSGRPLDEVSVKGAVVKKIGRGEFDLSSVAPGARIHITAPGFVPVCRVVGTEGQISVEMSPGRTAQVEYVAATSMNGPDGFFELPGSDCPVNVYHFRFERVMGGSPNASFVFSNFPLRGFITTPSGTRVELPATGGLSLQWK